jgi:hypothetical protein
MPFAIEIKDDTDLGLGVLVAVGDGDHEVIAVVGTLNEAREAAGEDMKRRAKLWRANTDALIPDEYIVWARGEGGKYDTVAACPVESLKGL